MWEFIQKNYEWLFGGFGVAFVFFVLEKFVFKTITKTSKKKKSKNTIESNNNQNLEVNITNNLSSHQDSSSTSLQNKNAIIDSKKDKIGILFIDDDKNFNVVKILKDSDWKKTKYISDIKSLDVKQVKNADIIFVDINGVGKILNLKYEGLDLALMLKQKYPEKKIIIYSANKTSNSFHEAWDITDARLEKNALPYQFQNLVEKFSLEL